MPNGGDAQAASAGRELERDLGDALHALGRELAEHARRKVEIARGLAEQVEAEEWLQT